MDLLRCRGLTRRPFWEGLDLHLSRGEIVVLSGPTGAGKTLLLRSLADLDPVDGGEVVLQGEPRSALPPWRWRRRVLYVHQSRPRLPGSVADNLAPFASLEGAADGQGRGPLPADLLDPGLPPDADAERLSGGEAQGLALARALRCDPDVLLLDEATSAMDPETAARWEERLHRFAAAGRAILWVAHDEALAKRVATRRLRLRGGRLEA